MGDNPDAIAGRRIGILTASASRHGGGVFEAVVLHAKMLRDQGAVPIVFALEDDAAARDRDRFEDIPVVLSPVRGPRQIGYAPDLLQRLLAADLDLLHLHGIWMYPSRAGRQWALRSGKPYLVSPHNMLADWVVARGRWKKALARVGYERGSWAAASALHALTENEAAEIRRETGRENTVVVPNPGPPVDPSRRPERSANLVYIGRIARVKNLASLVAAWHALDEAGRLPGDAELTIAGWGDQADVAKLEQALSGAPDSIRFVGPVFGEEKRALMAEAGFVVLPSLGEGLPMAMLEAWADGLPTIMTRACNLPIGFEAGAAIACDTQSESIGDAIATALALEDDAYRAMSEAALALAENVFDREVIAARWARVYADLMKGKEPR